MSYLCETRTFYKIPIETHRIPFYILNFTVLTWIFRIRVSSCFTVYYLLYNVFKRIIC